MADPEIPEVRAELQRRHTPRPDQRGLGALGWLLLGFGAVVVVVSIGLHALS